MEDSKDSDRRLKKCRCYEKGKMTRVRMLSDGYADFCVSCGRIIPGSFRKFRNKGTLPLTERCFEALEGELW